MEIAIGMPGMIPGVSSADLLLWAQRAEARGFSSLVFDDRLVWGGYEILVSAAAAAAVTSTISLTTAVVVATLRHDVTTFAKQVASIDRLSGGRLVLGLGVGSRVDDFAAAEIDMGTRGAFMDSLLVRSRAIWSGEAEPIGPSPMSLGGPPLLFGGASPATFRRIATYDAGWVCATSGGVEGVIQGRAKINDAYARLDREGTPKVLALAPRFALGPNGQEAVDGYLRAYNAYRGQGANQRAAAALVTPALIHEQIDRFEAAGVDTLIIGPCDPNPDQVDLLADAIAAR
jgi:alkanesulfonate monooxygenase SsuD/methylene tetrahydromethanopterin reductase-like flavin-dependent oxidoreductase (luciferase family)